MQRKTLLVSTLAVLMAGSTAFAIAQDAPAPPPAGDHAMPGMQAHAMDDQRSDRHRDGGMRHHDSDGERGGVIGDVRVLEQIYMRAGRSKELPALYNDVLSKSQDPRVRDYVYRQMARAQLQPANFDTAIATMRKALDESLANEAKMRAGMEKVRAMWQQHHGDKTAPDAQ
ncbi:MAG: hypothetical protein ABI365_00500 [Lysobacteraceae bacterium]